MLRGIIASSITSLGKSDYLLNWPFTTNGKLTGGQVPNRLFSRPSVLGYFDSSGDWNEVGVDLPVVDHDPDNSDAALGLHCGGQATNQIRNPVMAGAVVATDTLPNFWADVSADLVPTVEAIGVVRGEPYIDLRWNGTPTVDPVLAFEEADRVPVVQNNVNTLSMRSAIIAGDMTNITDVSLQLHEYDATPTSLATVNGTGFTPDATDTAYREVLTSTNAGTVFGRPEFRINWDGAGAIDITIRFYLNQFEAGPVQTAYMRSDGVNAETRNAQILTSTTLSAEWPTVGIINFTGQAPHGVQAAGEQVVLEIGDTANDQFTISRQSDNDVRVSINVGGGGVDSIDIANWLDGEDITLDIIWIVGGNLSVSRDGGAYVATAITGSAFTGAADMSVAIGHDAALANFFNGGHVGSLTVKAPTPLVLDGVANVHSAFSFRKVRTDYTGACISLKQVTSGGVADIGFGADGRIDHAAALAHLAGEAGWVATYYDQGPDGLDYVAGSDGRSFNYDATGFRGTLPSPMNDTDGEMLTRNYAGNTLYNDSVANTFGWMVLIKPNGGGNVLQSEGDASDSSAIYWDRIISNNVHLTVRDDADVSLISEPIVGGAGYTLGTLVQRTRVDVAGEVSERHNGVAEGAFSYTRGVLSVDRATIGGRDNGGFSGDWSYANWDEILYFKGAIASEVRDAIEADQMAYGGIS